MEDYFDNYARQYGWEAMRDEEERVYDLRGEEYLDWLEENNIDVESEAGQESMSFMVYCIEKDLGLTRS